MFKVKAQITRCISDEGYDRFVECQFIDAHGNLQTFIDKDVIFCLETLDRNSHYPIEGIIGCEIIERKNLNGRKIVKINTSLPWGTESIEGKTTFEVLEEQLIEFEHSPG